MILRRKERLCPVPIHYGPPGQLGLLVYISAFPVASAAFGLWLSSFGSQNFYLQDFSLPTCSLLSASQSLPLSLAAHLCVCIQPTPISRSPGSGVEPLPLDVPSRSNCAPAVSMAWKPSDSLLPGLPGA